MVSDSEELDNLDASGFSEDPPQIRIILHVEKSTTMFFEAESDGSPPSDTLTDDGEARNDFLDDRWEVSVVITLNQELSYAPKEEFPIPLRDTDVVRRTNTILDVLLESRIDDSWNVEGDRNLAEPWTGFTQFTALNAKPPDGYTWSGERLTKVHSNIKGRSLVARNVVKYVECGSLKNRSSIMRDSWETSILSIWLFLSVFLDEMKLAAKKQNLDPMRKNWMKHVVIWENLHLFLIMCTWDALNVNVNLTKVGFDEYRKMFESRVYTCQNDWKVAWLGEIWLGPDRLV